MHILIDILGLKGIICVCVCCFFFFPAVYFYPQRNESNWNVCYTVEDVPEQGRLIQAGGRVLGLVGLKRVRDALGGFPGGSG